MSAANRPIFPASIVGSMPRSQYVRDLLDPDLTPDDPAVFEKRMNAAVDYIISLQEAAGLDVVSDGEYRRRSYIGIIADVAEGFHLERNDGVWWHTVVDTLKHTNSGLAAREAEYIRARTDKLVKVCLPSPYLLAQRMWNPERSTSAYKTRVDFMDALVPILRKEVELLRDAGADIVQFDDPHLCLFVDDRIRAEYDDPDGEIELCVSHLNQILDGIDGITRCIHLCRRNKGRSGWVGEGSYEPILPALQALNVDQYVMEFTIPVAGNLDVLKELPDGSQVGLGCVDCRGEIIDPVDAIVDRVEKALEHLSPNQIYLNPDCGFAPGNAADIPIDEAYAKLCNEAKASVILRNRHA